MITWLFGWAGLPSSDRKYLIETREYLIETRNVLIETRNDLIQTRKWLIECQDRVRKLEQRGNQQMSATAIIEPPVLRREAWHHGRDFLYISDDHFNEWIKSQRHGIGGLVSVQQYMSDREGYMLLKCQWDNCD